MSRRRPSAPGYARRGSEALAYSIGDTAAVGRPVRGRRHGHRQVAERRPVLDSDGTRHGIGCSPRTSGRLTTVMRDVWIEYFDAVQEVGDR